MRFGALAAATAALTFALTLTSAHTESIMITGLHFLL
jgi:hypothetical protein